MGKYKIKIVFTYLLLSVLTCCAQDKKYNMVIYQTDGSKVRYKTESIDSITFSDYDDTTTNSLSGISVKKIYGDGSTYCAFTSLVKRANVYYLAFREGDSHVAPGDYGVIRIMSSLDGEIWDLMQTLSVSNIDLRDPDISIMPEGKLMVLCGARILTEDNKYITRTYCSIENNNKFCQPELVNLPQEVCWDECSWVWRLTWQDKVGYGVCYGDGGITLVKTIDGKTFDIVKHLDINGEPNECQIRFDADKTAYMMVRRSGETGRGLNGYMGISNPPYNQWKWKELSIYLAGQDFVIDKNRIVVATRMTQNIGDRTSLWFGNLLGEFSWCYTLPYGGESGKSDTAYAGLLDEEKEYWVSYYAIHEGEKPSIYLVKLSKHTFGSLYDN